MHLSRGIGVHTILPKLEIIFECRPCPLIQILYFCLSKYFQDFLTKSHFIQIVSRFFSKAHFMWISLIKNLDKSTWSDH